MRALVPLVPLLLVAAVAAVAMATPPQPSGALQPAKGGMAGEAAAVLLETEAATKACMGAPHQHVHRGVDVVVSQPVDRLEHDNMGGGGGLSHLNNDMYHHKALEESSGEETPQGNGTSCCNGLLCPYEAAVCCPGSTHCCRAGFICSADFPPTCVDERVDDEAEQQGPVRLRVTRIVVKRNNTVTHVVNVPKPTPPTTAQGPTGTMGAPNVADYFSSQPDVPVKPSLPPGMLNNANFDGPPKGSTGEVATEAGTPWPPMVAFAPDGGAEPYVAEEQRDWAGQGLIRNGSFNLVGSEAECKRQCSELPECRAARFTRTNGECWLDSEVAPSPSPCPAVMGLHNCVTFVKRVAERDVLAFPYPDAVALQRGFWNVADGRNWVPSSADVADRGGRLIRNGKRNLLPREEDCVKQCAGLRHCAVAMYIRPTGECWLSSKVAATGVPCALRGSQRNCASYVKLKKDEVRAADTAPLDASPAGGSGSGSAAAGTVTATAGNGDQTFTITVEQPN